MSSEEPQRRLAGALVLLAGAAWAPFVTAPLSPDEGGFLLVASQWRAGPSLYGHYWVDRPPLLLTVFDLAAHLGGAVALRLIGIAAVAGSVTLTFLLARTVAGSRALMPTVVAAVFLSTPLFGTKEVDGELLAVPLVLAGALALVHAWPAATRVALPWAATAGGTAMAAALVKQNVVDVFVVAAALIVVSTRTAGLRRVGLIAAGFAGGGAATLGAVLALAEAKGTEPARLWQAIVVFRAHASAVIDTSASSATSDRFLSLLEAAALSGAPLVLAVLLLGLRGPARPGPVPDLRVPALALLGWELIAVVGGGSYWPHYLTGIVPGLVLVAVAAAQREPRLVRSSAAAIGVAAVSCLAALAVWTSVAPAHSDDVAVAAYLRSHGSPDDTVVVGFGHPDIVYDAGMRSPYAELWSLPVRVRDPSLVGLTRVLLGRRAPTWVVVSGTSLATWGVDADAAQRALEERYGRVADVGSYVVWHRSVTADARSGQLRPRVSEDVVNGFGSPGRAWRPQISRASQAAPGRTARRHPGKQVDRGVAGGSRWCYSEPSVSEASWWPGSLGSASGPTSLASWRSATSSTTRGGSPARVST